MYVFVCIRVMYDIWLFICIILKQQSFLYLCFIILIIIILILVSFLIPTTNNHTGQISMYDTDQEYPPPVSQEAQVSRDGVANVVVVGGVGVGVGVGVVGGVGDDGGGDVM